ncbi:hypothetical protein VCRA2126O85_20004 [Vibrio crassostreae]|nr:hypothetical protein VCRA2127O91_20005 [Vibrio crassostreae]CAK2819694.1 hypothetical protein VCRA2126O86_20004 [Vibrio crassostreae]CAK2823828.1 hypothetical protein VCRA2126O85_20004 [Vibrio crassostreae]CAK2825600.1 hypothetical protein VCRA2125O83_20005 [Vibrio crassostreae]CAK2918493.1 hypothetical protein VCRA2126O84_30004 [Vibrio crassostreae]
MLDAAKRELYEETSLTGIDWVQLDSMCMLPRVFYSGHEKWSDHPYVIPEYSFSVHYPEFDFTILDLNGFSLEIVQADEKVCSSKSGTVLYWFVASLPVALAHFETLGAHLYRSYRYRKWTFHVPS